MSLEDSLGFRRAILKTASYRGLPWVCFKCGMPGQLLAGRLIRPIALTTFTLDSEVWQTFGSPEVGWPRENSCMQDSALCLELFDPQTNESPSTPVKNSGPAVFVQSCLKVGGERTCF